MLLFLLMIWVGISFNKKKYVNKLVVVSSIVVAKDEYWFIGGWVFKNQYFCLHWLHNIVFCILLLMVP